MLLGYASWQQETIESRDVHRVRDHVIRTIIVDNNLRLTQTEQCSTVFSQYANEHIAVICIFEKDNKSNDGDCQFFIKLTHQVS